MEVNLFRRTLFGRLLSDLQFVCLDIGSRGGFDPDVEPIAFAVNAYGFEPHPDECRRLSEAAGRDSSPWRSVRYLPLALSGTGGRRTLHVPFGNEGASLLEHDPAIGRAFDNSHLFTISQRVEVDTVKLDEAVGACGVSGVDYLKLDIEGAELEVLESGPETLGKLLVVKAEVSFLYQRRGQPLASDIDLFLRERGFVLMDFTGTMRWRRKGKIAHPQMRRGAVPYSKGQLAHGDYLYFRDLSRLNEDSREELLRTLRAGCLAMTWGFFDYASELLTRPRCAEYLRRAYGVDVAEALRDASARYGRVAWATAFYWHLRGVVPFLRSAGAALLPRRGRPRPPQSRPERREARAALDDQQVG